MKFIRIFLIALIFVCAAISYASNLENEFNKLSDEILDNLQKYFPVTATQRGIHDYNDKFTNYSARAVKDEITTLRQFEKKLHNFKYSALSTESKVDWKLIKSNVDLALHELQKVRDYKKNPYLYVDNAINGIYLILASEYAPMESRLPAVISRMRAIPTLLNQGQNNITAPAPLLIKLAGDLTGDAKEFFRTVSDELSASYPNMAADISDAAQMALTALAEYDQFLATVIPGEETAFALGKSDYDYRLQNQHFLGCDSDSLLRLGENMLARYDSLYTAYKQWLKDSVHVDSVKYPIDCVDRQMVLDYYDWELEQVKNFIAENNLMTVPDDLGKCEVHETPKFLQSVIPSIAYQPPGVFSPVQTGIFYVKPLPDKFEETDVTRYSNYIQRRSFRGGIVHEAYPGHHFQFQMASRVTDKARKWQENSSYYEGWALYCEELMYNEGLYGEDKERYARILNGIRWRAARIILDVKLQIGAFTPEEAWKWVFEKFGDGPSDTLWAQREVNWSTMAPTVPMSYLVGKLELLKLRDEYKAMMGDKYSLKDFHDKFLSVGSIPPPLIKELWGM